MDKQPNLMQMAKERVCDFFDLVAVLSGLLALYLMAMLIINAAQKGAGGMGDFIAIIAFALVPNQLAQAMHRLLTR